MKRLTDPVMTTVKHYGQLTEEVTSSGAVRLRYLGYPIHLSVSELRLLYILWDMHPSHTDREGFVSVEFLCNAVNESVKRANTMTEEEILAIFFGPKDPTPQKRETELTAATLAAVIERINRKASAIGGRKLIQGKSHHGYRINPYM